MISQSALLPKVQLTNLGYTMYLRMIMMASVYCIAEVDTHQNAPIFKRPANDRSMRTSSTYKEIELYGVFAHVDASFKVDTYSSQSVIPSTRHLPRTICGLLSLVDNRSNMRLLGDANRLDYNEIRL